MSDDYKPDAGVNDGQGGFPFLPEGADDAPDESKGAELSHPAPASAHWEDETAWHASDGDLFSPRALCGATASSEPDGHLRLHSGDAHVSCTACRYLLLRVTS